MGRCRVQKSRNREYSAIISLSSLHTFLVDFLPRVFLRIVILLNTKYCKHTGFPGGSDSKESACNAGDPASTRRSGRFPWKREWLCIPVFLPREFNGQRSLAGYSPPGHKESDMTEQLTLSQTHRKL